MSIPVYFEESIYFSTLRSCLKASSLLCSIVVELLLLFFHSGAETLTYPTEKNPSVDFDIDSSSLFSNRHTASYLQPDWRRFIPHKIFLTMKRFIAKMRSFISICMISVLDEARTEATCTEGNLSSPGLLRGKIKEQADALILGNFRWPFQSGVFTYCKLSVLLITRRRAPKWYNTKP